MEKFTVLLNINGELSVDVSNIKEACAAVSGFHYINDVQAKQWVSVAGDVYCIKTKVQVGYIDYHCNYWLGPRSLRLDTELPYFNFAKNRYNYGLQLPH